MNYISMDRYNEMEERVKKAEAEVAHVRTMLPDIPLRERECKTLDDWRHRALYLESQWSGCSHQCARIQDRAERAEARIAELERERDAAIKELAKDVDL